MGLDWPLDIPLSMLSGSLSCCLRPSSPSELDMLGLMEVVSEELKLKSVPSSLKLPDSSCCPGSLFWLWGSDSISRELELRKLFILFRE